MAAGPEVTAPARSSGRAGLELPQDPLTLESWGWTSAPEACGPKIAALASLFNLAPPDPVARISYQSRGNLLVIAGQQAERARRAAAELAGRLHVTLLDSASPQAGSPYASWAGTVASVQGFLGDFTVTLAGLRIADGLAAEAAKPAKFDLILDFSAAPAFAMRQPPQGYFRAPDDDARLLGTMAELRDAVGEFEKPKFFSYRENICAHSRSEVKGCTACIDICSTRAIESDGDKVKVDPHLCMGCGACATVCPSGAMSYQYPRVAERGTQIKQLLSTYRHAGGADACIVFHDGVEAPALLARAANAGPGLPPRALPLETWHVAAIGLDLLLPAIAFGASQVVVLCTGNEDPEYVEASRAQMAIGQAMLAGLGYEGRHFELVQATDEQALHAAFTALAPAQVPAVPATFLLGNDKRTAIEFAIEHLVKHAPRKVEALALPAGAPFGEVLVDRAKCTMCMACVGACPESALMDGVDQPLLKFLERNCVQCGLCEATCPEEAIALAPRLLLTPRVREARVLNETQPFHCIKCQKPFGTRQMVDTMMGRLAGHSMFAGGEALKRLQMCADCRVVDMMASKNEMSILKMGADS